VSTSIFFQCGYNYYNKLTQINKKYFILIFENRKKSLIYFIGNIIIFIVVEKRACIAWFSAGMFFEKFGSISGCDKMDEEIRNIEDNIYKILIVDDEREVLETLKCTLESAEEFKSEIKIAEDGKTALNELNKYDFDLILSDFKMPKMDGIALLNTVKERFPNLIRILITGYSNFNLMRKAMNKAEVHHFIEKPWNNDELTYIIYKSLKTKLARENELRKWLERKYGKEIEDIKNHLLN